MAFDSTDYFRTEPAKVYDKDNPPTRMSEAIRMAVADVEAKHTVPQTFNWGTCRTCVAAAVATRLGGKWTISDVRGMSSGWQRPLDALSALTMPGYLDNTGHKPDCGGLTAAFHAWPGGFRVLPRGNDRITEYNKNPAAFKRDMLELADRLEAEGS